MDEYRIDKNHILRLYDYEPKYGEVLDDNVAIRYVGDTGKEEWYMQQRLEVILKYLKRYVNYNDYFEAEKILMWEVTNYDGEQTT